MACRQILEVPEMTTLVKKVNKGAAALSSHRFEKLFNQRSENSPLFSFNSFPFSLTLTRFKPSTTSASTIDFTLPFELLFVLLLLPCIIKLVCLINFLALGDRRKRSERGTVGSWDGSLFDKFISGHILWISLIPSLTVDRLCILSSACSAVGTVVDTKQQFGG